MARCENFLNKILIEMIFRVGLKITCKGSLVLAHLGSMKEHFSFFLYLIQQIQVATLLNINELKDGVSLQEGVNVVVPN